MSICLVKPPQAKYLAGFSRRDQQLAGRYTLKNIGR
jgi:hypothetical protein